MVDFSGHDLPTMLWLRLSASHPARRCVALAAATEVCFAISSACPARVGVVFSKYGYTPMQSTVII